MRHHFIADLHLGPERPDHCQRLCRLLAGLESGRDELYILGDLFEVWLGDDAMLPFQRVVVDDLTAATRRGVAIAVMQGNRDFLLGTDFAAQTGCRLIDDPTRVTLAGQSALLCHGDTLCTDDHEYQAYRAHVRDPAVQQAFLALPIEKRLEIARQHRLESQQRSADKQAGIMDVNATTVLETMRRHGVRLLIHGHTHRPARHRVQFDDEAGERIVLADWREHGHCLTNDDEDGEFIERIID